MEFGNLNNFNYIIIPLLIFFILIFGGIKKEKILSQIGWSSQKKITFFRSLFLFLGSILIFISFLSPRKLEESASVDVKGSDIYILMDISKSMLATDVYPNRLEASKRELKEIIGQLKGDRIGLIPFSDSAYVQMPLTDDYFMAFNYIDVIDSKLISGGGTQLLSALRLANESFNKSKAEDKNVLIFSDGGEDSKSIEEFANNNNIKVFSFGVGTSEGSVIPEKNGFVKNNAGEIVITKLNDSLLKNLANETSGGYYKLNNISSGFEKFLNDIDSVKKNKTRAEEVKVYTYFYYIPLILGMILILLGFIMKRRVNK